MKNTSVIFYAATAAAITFAAPAHAAPTANPPHMSGGGQWCPGQPWELEWGVNPDSNHCHGIADPDDDDSDLDDSIPGYDSARDYPDGQYPPDYDWGDRYDDRR